MKVLIAALVFVVLPIVFFILIGRYFSKLDKKMEDKSFAGLKKAMSPRAFRFMAALIGALIIFNFAVRFYNSYSGR